MSLLCIRTSEGPLVTFTVTSSNSSPVKRISGFNLSFSVLHSIPYYTVSTIPAKDSISCFGSDPNHISLPPIQTVRPSFPAWHEDAAYNLVHLFKVAFLEFRNPFTSYDAVGKGT